MATGPEHYREAEKCLAILDAERDPREWVAALADGSVAIAMQAAQVHATLAHAAATAMFLPLDPASERRPLDEDAWHKVAGEYTDISGQQT